jgi:glycosidase
MLNDLWYKNAIVYCLSVGTYMDANGDGIGDFEGLNRRLDYLQGLGITTLWLMPFQPSPCRDNGYDISDYYNVDPRYGTLGDFADFTNACRQRGLRVMIDLVVNHTSDQHAWFQDARRDPSSKYRDWYVWSKKKPLNAKDGIVFPGVQKSTWTYDKQAALWYFHRFYSFQPDLNTANPHVQAELLKIMGFWIQLGVSGFRMDAVPFVIATKGAKVKVPVEQYNMLRTFREFRSTEPHGGFTKHTRPASRVISGGPYGFERINVANQRRDPDSFLNWTERMIRMRREIPEISWGDFAVLRASRKEVLALRYDWRNNSVVCLHNFSAVACPVKFKTEAGDSGGTLLVNLLSDEHSEADSTGRHTVVLEPFGYRWYRQGGLDYLLKRSDV